MAQKIKTKAGCAGQKDLDDHQYKKEWPNEFR